MAISTGLLTRYDSFPFLRREFLQRTQIAKSQCYYSFPAVARFVYFGEIQGFSHRNVRPFSTINVHVCHW